ncbi:MAG: response regulator transcription factor [Candidatus Acidiferrales bacterium]
MVRILIADDHQNIRTTLSQFIRQSDPEWEICGEAADGKEAVVKAQALKPDVVILDFVMPHADGLRAGREIRARLPDALILVYTFMVFPQLVRLAREAGLHGVMHKADSQGLVTELREVLASNPPSEMTGENPAVAPIPSVLTTGVAAPEAVASASELPAGASAEDISVQEPQSDPSDFKA